LKDKKPQFLVRSNKEPVAAASGEALGEGWHHLAGVLDKDKKLIAFFPITAGSSDKPAPSGELRIRSVVRHPTYRYNPAYAFKGVRSQEPFTVAAGPNNPVGLVWIGLPGEGFGIHGTPEPGKVGKTESHGCIRMTNWDVLQLADLVSKGTPVAFLGDDTSKRKATPRRRRHR